MAIRIEAGRSDRPMVAYAGAAGLPVLLPKNVCAAALDNAKLSAGVVVGVATLVVKIGERLPAEKLVTVPVPPPPPGGSCQVPSSLRKLTIPAVGPGSGTRPAEW